MIDKLTFLVVVTDLPVYVYVKTHWIAHFKYVQLIDLSIEPH